MNYTTNLGHSGEGVRHWTHKDSGDVLFTTYTPQALERLNLLQTSAHWEKMKKDIQDYADENDMTPKEAYEDFGMDMTYEQYVLQEKVSGMCQAKVLGLYHARSAPRVSAHSGYACIKNC